MKIDLEDNKIHGLGVIVSDSPELCYSKNNDFLLAKSSDGLEFEKDEGKVFTLLGSANQKVDPKIISNIRISPLFKKYIMFFDVNGPDKSEAYMALSDDGLNWKAVSVLPPELGLGLNVEYVVHKDQHVYLLL